jgi:hypothetical protein
MDEENNFRKLSLAESLYGSPNQFWQSGYQQGQQNIFQYDDSMARSLIAQLGNVEPHKPRHIQLLDEAKARHPEWVVKRKET